MNEKITPGRPLYDDLPSGLLESDRDFVNNNISACVAFLEEVGVEEHLEITLAWLRKYPISTLGNSDGVALGLHLESTEELLSRLKKETLP